MDTGKGQFLFITQLLQVLPIWVFFASSALLNCEPADMLAFASYGLAFIKLEVTQVEFLDDEVN